MSSQLYIIFFLKLVFLLTCLWYQFIECFLVKYYFITREFLKDDFSFSWGKNAGIIVKMKKN